MSASFNFSRAWLHSGKTLEKNITLVAKNLVSYWVHLGLLSPVETINQPFLIKADFFYLRSNDFIDLEHDQLSRCGGPGSKTNYPRTKQNLLRELEEKYSYLPPCMNTSNTMFASLKYTRKKKILNFKSRNQLEEQARTHFNCWTYWGISIAR